ncbi:MAG: hypothetical protein P0120_23610 [Nitrospira sp.]|nr:hypothetical protein [Nitrospira sp.]
MTTMDIEKEMVTPCRQGQESRGDQSLLRTECRECRGWRDARHWSGPKGIKAVKGKSQWKVTKEELFHEMS